MEITSTFQFFMCAAHDMAHVLVTCLLIRSALMGAAMIVLVHVCFCLGSLVPWEVMFVLCQLLTVSKLKLENKFPNNFFFGEVILYVFTTIAIIVSEIRLKLCEIHVSIYKSYDMATQAGSKFKDSNDLMYSQNNILRRKTRMMNLERRHTRIEEGARDAAGRGRGMFGIETPKTPTSNRLNGSLTNFLSSPQNRPYILPPPTRLSPPITARHLCRPPIQAKAASLRLSPVYRLRSIRSPVQTQPTGGPISQLWLTPVAGEEDSGYVCR
ncbi:hypothetical protein AAMO2058_001354000 [Amorphochlora amoebiformis]